MGQRMMPGAVHPADTAARVAEHRRLAELLPAEDREWLARAADVLPWGWVVNGMATPPGGGVVGDDRYPGGIRVVVPPAGRAGIYAKGGPILRPAPRSNPGRPSRH